MIVKVINKSNNKLPEYATSMSAGFDLRANLEEILNRQDKIELNELTLLGMDKISAYISLLFLTAESDYDLEQDEFYSDLYVVKRSHEELTNSQDREEFDSAIDNAKSVLVDNSIVLI